MFDTTLNQTSEERVSVNVKTCDVCPHMESMHTTRAVICMLVFAQLSRQTEHFGLVAFVNPMRNLTLQSIMLGKHISIHCQRHLDSRTLQECQLGVRCAETRIIQSGSKV